MTSKMIRTPGVAAACLMFAATIGTTSASQAAMVAALQDGGTLTMIDTTKMQATGSVKLDGGAMLVGIDVRPSDGRLYGLARDGAIVTIDAKTGKWEKKSQLSEKLGANVEYAVDFNPAADRLRVIGSDGSSLRINVDDGKAVVDGTLKFADADANKGKTPKVTAAAYSNSFAGSKETALYDVDMTTGTLLRQAPPNDGIVNTIGAFGMTLAGPVAFDIASDGKGGNNAWLLSAGTLHAVDLASGAAKPTGAIKGLTGKIIDMAVLPAM
jgi:hypothetical protein